MVLVLSFEGVEERLPIATHRERISERFMDTGALLRNGAVCHDLLEFCARVLTILANPSRQLPSARLLGRWGWS